MRADEREKLLKEIEKTEAAEATRSMYCRIGKSAYRTITEMAEISGTKKSEVVRKLVMRGLTGKDIEVAKESVYVKLDWLLRQSKRNQPDMDALFKGVKDIRERLEGIEHQPIETPGIANKLLVEIYCLLSAIFYSQTQSLSRLIKVTSQSFKDIKNSEEIAHLETALYIANALSDLDNLASFHKLKIGRAAGDKNFTGTKVESIYRKVAGKRKED